MIDMSPIILFSFVIGYFVLLLTVAYFTCGRDGEADCACSHDQNVNVH